MKARELGSFYADGEFDLTRLRHLRDATMEIGRSCVHPDFITADLLMLLPLS